MQEDVCNLSTAHILCIMLLIRKPHLEKNIQNFLSPSSLIPNGHYSGSIAFLALHQQIQANEKDFRRGPAIPDMSLIFSSKNLPFSPASNFRCPFLLSCSGKIANRSPVSSCNIVHFFCQKLSSTSYFLPFTSNSVDPFETQMIPFCASGVSLIPDATAV